MKSTEQRRIGAGAWEALRRQRERAEGLPVSEELEERVMGRVAMASQHTEKARRGRARMWRVAASTVLVALMGGLAVAAVVMGQGRAYQRGEGGDTVAAYRTTEEARGTEGTVVAFEVARLDSIMGVIGGYYGRRVCFREERMKDLRLHTKWNRREPLATFIESMNELDGLRISDERDTLFVWKGGEE